MISLNICIGTHVSKHVKFCLFEVKLQLENALKFKSRTIYLFVYFFKNVLYAGIHGRQLSNSEDDFTNSISQIKAGKVGFQGNIDRIIDIVTEVS